MEDKYGGPNVIYLFEHFTLCCCFRNIKYLLFAEILLKKNTTLTHLDLSKCGITQDGLCYLIGCLPSLQQLYLDHNSIGSDGMETLGKCLQLLAFCKKGS